MKKIIVLFALISLNSIISAANPGTVLFSDTFDRASTTQVNDLNATTTGKSGILGALEYVEQGDNILQTETFTNLENDQLHLADGPNASTLYINHNFSDSQILTDKGLRIGLTIVSNDGVATDQDRWCGFAVGNSYEECSNSILDYNFDGDNGTTAPFYRFRGSLDRGQSTPGISDIFIGWAPQNGGVIQVFKNGSTVTGGKNYNITGITLSGNNDDRLELELYFDDMNEGTEVTAYILWNSELVGIDTFAWDHTNDNYIAITSRQSNSGFTVDDLVIDTVFNDRATAVSPEDMAIDIAPESITLEWNPGAGAVVSKHLLSVTTKLDVNGDPNFVGTDPIYSDYEITDVTSFTIPNTLPDNIKIGHDQTVYWKVDEDYGSYIAYGPVWQFDTVKSLPVIEEQPASVLYYPYDSSSYEGDPKLTCEFSSLSAPSIAWYKEGNTTPISTAAPVYDAEKQLYITSITIEDLIVADEGAYYCELTNSAVTGDIEPVKTSIANIGVKRLKAHWTFEELVNNVYPDSTGNHDADPNTNPSPEQFYANEADPIELGNALDLELQGDAAADSGVWAAAAYTNEVSFSAWINCSVIGVWQGIISNRTAPNAESGNVWLEITPTGQVQIAVPGAAFVSPVIETDKWMHVAGTAGASGVVVYIDGLPVVSNSNPISINTLDVPVFVGALNRVGDTLAMANPLRGKIDDARVYNYALSHEEVVDLYYEMLEIPVCMNPNDPMLRLDANNDCQIDMFDFSQLAADWFECNYYPTSGCFNQ